MVHDIVNADGSEKVKYNRPDFPVRAFGSMLSELDSYSYICHWHRDFEITSPIEGELEFFINGQTVHLRQGDAVFVNTGRLHYGYSSEKKECYYEFAVFHPDLFGEQPAILQEIRRITQDGQPDFIVLHRDNPEEQEAIHCFRRIITDMCEEQFFAAVSDCAAVLDYIGRQLPGSEEAADPDWGHLRQMTGYVQMHYQESIRLEEIAAAGMICRSRCCKLFREKMNCTPIEYVMNYRLNKACELLGQGAAITEAALSCGFNGVSYFSESFKKKFGITPREYKERTMI